MKALIASTLMALAPGLVLAQTPAPAAKPEAKPEAKRPLPRSTLKAVEENTPIDEDTSVTLTPADIEVAKRVYVGEIPCELGASINIAPARREGFFLVRTKDMRFYMHPVESRTGAIRLEDPKRGAMWLQLGNKSMLMSQKLGQRLADDCMNPAQHAVNEALKKNPAPSLLDAPAPTK
ncbi:MAG: hypothetical protein U1E71_11430 [Ramlibacter sp.]